MVLAGIALIAMIVGYFVFSAGNMGH